METFEAFIGGELQTRLDGLGASYDKEASFDPYALLPAWLHPR
jgi:hypothetical protein